MRIKSYRELDSEIRRVWLINPKTRVKPLKKEQKIDNSFRCKDCITLDCDVCEYNE